jgi:hypothetical protein
MSQQLSPQNRGHAFPLWLKVACCLFLVFHLFADLRYYGPLNYLWFCDMALVTGTLAVCIENRLLVSMTFLSVLGPATAWSIDYLVFVTTGHYPIGISSYMSDAELPVIVRIASMFHLWLPVMLTWVLSRVGYDRRAILYQTLFAIALLIVCRTFTDPPPPKSARDVTNINSVFGNSDLAPTTTFPAWVDRHNAHGPLRWFGISHATPFPGWLYVTWVVLKYWVGMYLPIHLLAILVFDRQRRRKSVESVGPNIVATTLPPISKRVLPQQIARPYHPRP